MLGQSRDSTYMADPLSKFVHEMEDTWEQEQLKLYCRSAQTTAAQIKKKLARRIVTWLKKQDLSTFKKDRESAEFK